MCAVTLYLHFSDARTGAQHRPQAPLCRQGLGAGPTARADHVAGRAAGAGCLSGAERCGARALGRDRRPAVHHCLGAHRAGPCDFIRTRMPSRPAGSTEADCAAIRARRGVTVPPCVAQHLACAAAPVAALPNTATIIIGSTSIALAAATARGMHPPPSRTVTRHSGCPGLHGACARRGRARRGQQRGAGACVPRGAAASRPVRIAHRSIPSQINRHMLIGGGEVTVTVRGAGLGGRAQAHIACAAKQAHTHAGDGRCRRAGTRPPVALVHARRRH